MSEMPQVLVVEDEAEVLEDYLLNLSSDEYKLTGVRSLEDAIAALEKQKFDVVVTDLQLFNRPDGGMQVIERTKALDATIAVIMVTAYGSESIARRAIRQLGAQGFFPKPLDFDFCRKRIHQTILERRYRLAAIEAAAQGGFVPISSPYVAGKPLGQGSVMFYGRDEIFGFIRENIGEPPQHNHLALVGARRIGKTSILQQLPKHLTPSSFFPVYINCQSLGIDPGMPAFFLQLARQIRRGLKRQGSGPVSASTLVIPNECEESNGRSLVIPNECEESHASGGDLPILKPADVERMPAFMFMDKFLIPLMHANARFQTCSLVLCLDEFEELVDKVRRGRLDASVFEFLHSLMLDEPHIVFILAGTQRMTELGNVSRRAAEMVEMTTLRSIGPLSPSLARSLIEEPVAHSGMRYESEAIEAILEATGGYPYLIQLLCGMLVVRRNAQRRNEMRVADVQIAIENLLESPQPGFFWESLTLYQKAVLLAVIGLWQGGQVITPQRVAMWLKEAEVGYHNWGVLARHLLHELALQSLLHEEKSDDARASIYTLTFEMLGAWVRRHKTLGEIREEILHET
jgi:CheY-like chemotaxis protein